MTDRAAGPPASAAALVAALWRASPPDVWAPARPAIRGVTGPAAALARLAARADRLAARGPAAERPAARLLAETARAVAAALGTAAPGAPPLPGDDGRALASPVRLRLARMERWLAARAAADPAAGPSADLCLWVLESLEADGAGHGELR